MKRNRTFLVLPNEPHSAEHTGTRPARDGEAALLRNRSWWHSSVLDVHCHCCQDMNDGSGFVRGGEAQRCPMPRFLLDAGTRFSHYTCPSPHAATEKEQEPATSLGRQRVAECGTAEYFVLRHDARQPTRTLSTIGHQRTVFFTATARLIVLVWTSRWNFSPICLASSRARMGSPATSCSWINASTAPRTLCGPRGPRFLGTRPAIPASSKPALV